LKKLNLSGPLNATEHTCKSANYITFIWNILIASTYMFLTSNYESVKVYIVPLVMYVPHFSFTHMTADETYHVFFGKWSLTVC